TIFTLFIVPSLYMLIAKEHHERSLMDVGWDDTPEDLELTPEMAPALAPDGNGNGWEEKYWRVSLRSPERFRGCASRPSSVATQNKSLSEFSSLRLCFRSPEPFRSCFNPRNLAATAHANFSLRRTATGDPFSDFFCQSCLEIQLDQLSC